MQNLKRKRYFLDDWICWVRTFPAGGSSASVVFSVRHNFKADLVCSVYYDNFAKTVSSINGNIAIFSKKDFIKEFDEKIIYGFLFSLDIDTFFYEEDQDISDDEAAAMYEKHEKDVFALVTDILRFKMKTEATMM